MVYLDDGVDITGANQVPVKNYTSEGAVIPDSTDYRYYGANPNNYVSLDFKGSTTCPDKHLYRIIGSIYDELEGSNRLKVIKATQHQQLII